MQFVLTADCLIDGRGGTVAAPAIVVEDSTIVRVTHRADPSLPETATRIDLPGCTLMPGLIDAHVHLTFDGGPDPVASLAAERDERALLRMAVEARTMLRAGITTARDLGDRAFLSLPVRDAINEGLIEGPRLVCAGPPITTTAGHCWYLGGEADGEVAIRKGVRERVKRGVDCIKVMATGGGMTPGSNMLRAQFTVDELRAMVEESHRLGKHIAAHCHGTEGIVRAVEAGVDTLEHCTFAGPDGADFDERLVEQIAARGIAVSPTLAFSMRNLLAGVPDGRTTAEAQRFRRLAGTMRERLLFMRAAGCTFIASTDNGIGNSPHDALTASLSLWVRTMGFPADEVIRAATSEAARVIGVGAQTGAIEPGKQADIIAVDGNPLDEIEAIERVSFVMKGGTVHRERARPGVAVQ